MPPPSAAPGSPCGSLVTGCSASPELRFANLGRAAYGTALAVQQALVHDRRRRRGRGGRLLLLEHDPPVITLGRRASHGEVLASRAELSAAGISIHRASRGGRTTYHGPGQLVGYLVLDLMAHRLTLSRYVSLLEEAILGTLRRFGVRAGRLKGQAGAWIDGAKIASIGIAASGWVTYHGFALNVCPDLSHFDLIVPCGMREVKVTSMSEVLGREVGVDEVCGPIVESLADALGFTTIAEGLGAP
jgi:lipoate-protein ligase B